MRDSRLVGALESRGFAVLPDGEPRAIGTALGGRVSASELLIPREPANARPSTLSARVGYGEFPWHTDGAVALFPPDWLILRGVRFSQPTATELADPSWSLLRLLSRTVLKAQNANGGKRYFPAHLGATPGGGPRIRWDETKCRPNRADVQERIRCLEPSASIGWREGQALVVDNRRMLHRRPSVVAADRAIERLYVWAAR